MTVIIESAIPADEALEQRVRVGDNPYILITVFPNGTSQIDTQGIVQETLADGLRELADQLEAWQLSQDHESIDVATGEPV